MTRGRKQKKRERRARENERRDCTKLISDDHDGQLTGHHSCDRGGLSITCIFKNDDLQEISNLLGTAELDDSHALLGAIALGKFDVIKRLLKNGYSLEITSEGGLTPMLWAVKLKKIEVTDFLLRRGANIHAVDVEENNALLLALQATAWDQDSFLDFWNLIKDTNINLNHTNKSGNCALHYMVKRQWDVVLEKLLSNPKVNINLLTKKGVSALMMACSRHQEDTCSILLKYKANILIEDERGCTALCYAIAYLMQKHISPHNKIVIDLIEVHKYSGQTSIEAYVQRRLELVTNPTQENFTYTISSIIMHIVTYFGRCIEYGLDMLIALNLFKKIKMAIDRNLDNTDYCLCLFEIISQVVRGNEKPINNIDNEGLAQAFSESDLLPLMLRFIKRNGMENLKSKHLYSILQPLVHFSNHSFVKCWLQENFKALASSCSFELSMANSSLQYTSEIQPQCQKQVGDDFNSLMNKLNGELANREEKSAKKRRNNTRSRSVGQEEFGWTNTSNQAKFIKLDMALTSGKSEDDLKSLKMAESDNIKNVPSPILRGKEGLQDLCSGGDAKKNITDSISDTYWTINVPGNDNADQDEKLVYPKWKEEFKEGCALFETLEENRIEPIWELENGDGGDVNKHQPHNLDEESSSDKCENKTADHQETKNVDNDYETKIYNLDCQVKNIIKYYEQEWAKECANGYSGIKENREDFSQVVRIIPQLEKYHITKIKSSWCALTSRLLEKWSENKEEVLNTMNHLQIYLSDIIKQLETPNKEFTNSSTNTEHYTEIEKTNLSSEHELEEKEVKKRVTIKNHNVERHHDKGSNNFFYKFQDNYGQSDKMHLKYITANYAHLSFSDQLGCDIGHKNYLNNYYKSEQNHHPQFYRSLIEPECLLRNKFCLYNNEALHIETKEMRFFTKEQQNYYEAEEFKNVYFFNFFQRTSPPPGFSDIVNVSPQYFHE
ncbi:uncharacterized protein isoform X2 [Rhodnius prolixus]|uniref:uncharacterized protein isoform X2 n=1 Tax=Rhodnius prolixus TaxID=13249 RepID=UPI003D18C860